MPRFRSVLLSALALIGCTAYDGDSDAAQPKAAAGEPPFEVEAIGQYNEPWAMTFLPGGRQALITEKNGTLKLWTVGGAAVDVGGVPAVDYGGQGGLGDVILHPEFASNNIVYLSWAEAGEGGVRGAAVGRARLVTEGGPPRLEGLQVIWRQVPKMRGRGHYGHRLAFSPDGRLWEVEMGPEGGDEMNLLERGRNYGYPIVSNGDHYDGRTIPDHDTRPEFEAPKAWWTPVISPGDMIVYTGRMFPQWRGDALIASLSGEALIHVDIDGTNAREAQRWAMGRRMREIEQHPDGSIYMLEDQNEAGGGRLLRLVPRR